MTSLIRKALARYRSCWKLLVLTDIFYKAVAFVLLTPLFGFLFRSLLWLSGDTTLSDTDILAFLLGPAGWICFILSGGLWLAVIALEQASLLGILWGSAEGRRLGVLAAIRFALIRAIPVIGLTTRIVGCTLIVVAPFAIIAGIVYATLLTEFDINYYLNEKPPAFMIAVTMGCVLGVILTAMLLRLFSGWFFSLPIVLFEDVRPSKALGASKARSHGHRRNLILWILGWLLATSLLSAAATGASGLLGRLMVPGAKGSLNLMVLAIGTTLVIWAAMNMIVNLLSTTSLAMLIFSLYDDLTTDGPATDSHVNVDTLSQDHSLIAITRKRLIAAAVVGVGLSIGIGVYAVESIQPEDDVMIMAHRGSSKAAPENTMAAIERAIQDGADWVEIDVQETADDEVVVFHDSDFMKLSGMDLKIWDATAEELRAIDIGSWFAPEFSDQRVPTLAQVLDRCKGRIKVNIELKYYGHDKQLEQRVAEIVDSRQMASEVMLMSLKMSGVKKMKSIRPQWKVGLLMSVSVGNLAALDADFLAINARFAGRSLINRAHQVGKEVYVWTVNDAPSMSLMISRGVAGLLTDRPALARSVLEQRADLSGPERLLLEFAPILGNPPEFVDQ